jgi:16S rRNA (cytosine1402-N4)-methyltransferase
LPLYLEPLAEKLGRPKPLLVDGILLDLGLSSDQLADRERGFSFQSDGPLDLRYNPGEGRSAAEWLRSIDEEELANVIYQYGEERFSRRIARRIVEQRRIAPIETAKQLADLIHRSVPGRIHGRVDSATRTFQALRIAVNRELEIVEEALRELPKTLKPGGRFLVISFHSLEDRLVKHAFRDCAELEVLSKKPIVASELEMKMNPRSRSAKLRVARRLG